jgi:FkbH-like protein
MDSRRLRQELKAMTAREALLDRLSTLDIAALSAMDVNVAARCLKRFGEAPGLKIAYLGNQTFEPLPDYLEVYCACHGIATQQYVGPYNQHFQEVLAEGSGLRAFSPDVIFLALSLRDLAPELAYEFSALGEGERESHGRRILDQLRDWVAAAKNATGANLLIANFPAPAVRQSGLADYAEAGGEAEFYARLNLGLLELCQSEGRSHLFDLDGLASAHGKAKALNQRLYYLARREWDENFLPDMARELLGYVLALCGRTRKCLVLDLDNTLWGGVVGEDGPEGVKISKGDPEGEAYRAFHHAVLALKRRGVVLAINSKNNKEDVLEVFSKRDDMPLKLDDFAALEINWENKHENLAKIANSLNIGTDSLAFADDNPVECALVREMMPEVEVIELSGDPAAFAQRILSLPSFEKLEITAEDRQKARQYQENRKRTEDRETRGDLGAYLAGLETSITLRRPSGRDAARIHQLFTKTNQFNVTTKRYAPSEVAAFIDEEDVFDTIVVDVSDRYGDLGTVGLVLIDLRGEAPAIDSFIMSCRAMGREIETAIMNAIKADYLLGGGHKALVSAFVPTKKNLPVCQFYDRQGFQVTRESESGEKHYRLAADEAALLDCAHISLVNER